MKSVRLKIKNSGFIALTSVIIMSGFFVIIFIGMFFSAVEEAGRTGGRENSVKAVILANSCVEEALSSLRNSLSYAGNEDINIGDEFCTLLVMDGTETMKVIKAVGASDNYTKKMQVEVDILNHPSLRILDWREVSEFSVFAENEE
jgi:hypothetical protein